MPATDWFPVIDWFSPYSPSHTISIRICKYEVVLKSQNLNKRGSWLTGSSLNWEQNELCGRVHTARTTSSMLSLVFVHMLLVLLTLARMNASSALIQLPLLAWFSIMVSCFNLRHEQVFCPCGFLLGVGVGGRVTHLLMEIGALRSCDIQNPQ